MRNKEDATANGTGGRQAPAVAPLPVGPCGCLHPGEVEAVETPRAQGGTQNGGRASELAEIELLAAQPQVIADVSDDPTRHIARMLGEGDETVRAKWIRVMPMTVRSAEQLAADLPESPLQLATVERGVFAHGSGGENELVAEGRRDGAAGFEQRFQVGLGRLLEAQGGFAAVASLRVATGEEAGFGNPDAVLVLTELHFRKWNDHNGATVTRLLSRVKRAFHGWRLQQG
jgi:hypothetical protein